MQETYGWSSDGTLDSATQSEFELRNFSLLKNLTIDLEAVGEVSTPFPLEHPESMGNSQDSDLFCVNMKSSIGHGLWASSQVDQNLTTPSWACCTRKGNYRKTQQD